MARRNASFRGRPRSSGVARDWGAGPGSSSQVEFSASGSAILGSGVQTLQSELTLLRTRGIFDITIISATSAGHGYFGAVGIGVFSDQAFTAGVASLPTPLSDSFSNQWLWHHYFAVTAGEAGGLAGGPEAHQRVMIDAKAMRKFDANQVITCVIELVETGTSIVKVYMDSRILFQDSGR